MPIKGLSETRRLPRLGKIHLGIKKQAKSGAMYPSATDYFVVPPEIAEVLGTDKPTELPILFPVEDDEKFASQYYRSYSMTRGLVCRGDGETCRRMIDAQTGEMANRDTKEIVWKDRLPCEGRDCPYYGKQCREVMNLQFLLPTVEGLGVWQIDTSSINSIRNINSAIELIRGVYGRIAMIPLLLTLEPIEVVNPNDGKKKTVRVLNLRTKGTMLELMEKAVKPTREMLLPPPEEAEAPGDMSLPVQDDENPDLIMPQNQAADDDFWPEDTPPTTAVAVVKPEAVKPTEKPEQKIPSTIQELLQWVASHGKEYTRTWIVNKLKIEEERLSSETAGCYHEIKELAAGMKGWED